MPVNCRKRRRAARLIQRKVRPDHRAHCEFAVKAAAPTVFREGHPMANPFIHVELNTTDVAKAKSFYGKLFDWKLQDVPLPDGAYTIVEVGEGTGGGLMKHPIPGAPSTWLAYVLVDDVKAATAKAKSLGAAILKDVTEVPGRGWFSLISDPTGAALGLWQNKT
jgi:predicted enzyme related to lactoylglutathione lyase